MKLNLSEIKKRFQPRSALALTLESGHLSVSALSEEGESERSLQTLSISTGADEIVREPEKAAAKLSSALASAGIRQRRCVVCIPPGWALTASVDLPEVSPEDLRSYFELCAEREFPIAVSELRLGYCGYVMPDGQRRATLAAVPSKKIEAVEKMLETAGCRPVSISLALAECLSGTEPTLHFIANGTHADVIITAGGGVVSLRSLAHGTRGDEPAFDPVSLYREIRVTLGRLPEPIRQQVRRASFGGTPTSSQQLFGQTRDHLRQLGIENVACDSVENGDADGKPAAVASAVNAARSFLNGQSIAFEFLVSEASRWQVIFQRFDSKRHRLIVSVGVALIILPLIIFLARSRYENHLGTEWDGMKRNVAELEALQQKIHKFRPWFDRSPRILRVIESVTGAFPDQGDVWAKSVQVGEGNLVTCAGSARNQAAILSLLGRLGKQPGITEVRLQQTRGDNPVQFSFTCKWEPAQ